MIYQISPTLLLNLRDKLLFRTIKSMDYSWSTVKQQDVTEARNQDEGMQKKRQE
jgi:hypothetical protein